MVARRYTAEKSRSKKTRVNLHFRKTFQREIERHTKLRGGSGKILFYSLTARSRPGKRLHTLHLASKRYSRFFSKSYEIRLRAAIRDFNRLNELKEIPELRAYVPPTVRLIRGKKGKISPRLLLTDLTQNGRYRAIGDYDHPYFRLKTVELEIARLMAILKRNGYSATRDTFLLQVNPKNGNLVKIWISDAAGISRIKK